MRRTVPPNLCIVKEKLQGSYEEPLSTSSQFAVE